MFSTPKVIQMGGVFSVGKIADGECLPPCEVAHNALLSNFLNYLITSDLFTGDQHCIKIGYSDYPNDATTVSIVDGVHSANDYENTGVEELLSRNVTFDGLTRVITIREIYRRRFNEGLITKPIKEIGVDLFRPNAGSRVCARTVLATPVIVEPGEGIYVDYDITCLLQLPPESSTVVVTQGETTTEHTVLFRVEDIPTLSIFKALVSAGSSNSEDAAMGWNDYETFNLNFVKWIFPGYFNYPLEKPTLTKTVVNKVVTSKWAFSPSQANGAPAKGYISVVQTNKRFTYIFQPGIPKNSNIKVEFTFVDDYSGIQTL
jgi:hypothetical protein